VPVFFDFSECGIDFFDGVQRGDYGFAFDGGFADTKEDREGSAFAGSEFKIGLQCGEGHIACGGGVGAAAVQQGGGRGSCAVITEEGFQIAVEPAHVRAAQRKEGVPLLILIGEVLEVARHVDVRADVEYAVGVFGFGDVLGVLQVDVIVFGMPVALRFESWNGAQFARDITFIGNGYFPHFVQCALRNKNGDFAFDAGIGGFDDAVAGAVAAFIPELIERFADRHPCMGPEVAGVRVEQIDKTARLAGGGFVEAEAAQSALRGRFIKGIARGNARDESAELAAADVVAPRHRSIRAGDYIFLINIVKISVAHLITPDLKRRFSNRFTGSCKPCVVESSSRHPSLIFYTYEEPSKEGSAQLKAGGAEEFGADFGKRFFGGVVAHGEKIAGFQVAKFSGFTIECDPSIFIRAECEFARAVFSPPRDGFIVLFSGTEQFDVVARLFDEFHSGQVVR